MSFLWHGLTEQGAQVPVQVDAQGRVIAVDGTPGVSNWERTGTTLSPAVPGDSVDIGSISLNSDGSSKFAGVAEWGNYQGSIADSSGVKIYADGGLVTQRNSTQPQNQAMYRATYGTTITSEIRADGSATFAGNITATNVTFRSADPQFYVKKSKNKDAQPEYLGPELDLLAEIARLEALVRHLYETLRITPPAGWPVWDGNDDVLRQLRK